MTESDSELAGQVVDSDAASFEMLFRRYQNDVRLQVRRLVRDESAAEDVVQEVFLTVWERVDQWRGEGEFRAWLMRVASNAALSQLRKVQRRREQRLELSMPEADEGKYPEWLLETSAGPDILAERADERRLVNRLVEDLPDEQREAIRLYYDAELDVSDTAQRLGVPAGTVKSRLYHGRQQIARAWREKTEEE